MTTHIKDDFGNDWYFEEPTTHEVIAKLLWERFSLEHEIEWPSTHAAEYRSVATDVIEVLSKVTPKMIEASCKATVLGEGENYEPVHLEPREAITALKAAFSTYLPASPEHTP